MNTTFEDRRVLLQHARTHLYYVHAGDWTNDPARAHDFVLTQAAMLYSRSQGLSDARPVTYFHQPAAQHFLLPTAGGDLRRGMLASLPMGS